ncbi:MAG: DUF6588 family protein [Balneolaceae bacterium]|nr:DUF6588 family protein [Balneolaceae bacterium]
MKLRQICYSGIMVLILFAGSVMPAQAQFDDAGEILRAGQQDANILLEQYLKPVGKGFGADLNSGWFSTAKTHATLGFDITLNVGAAVVPSSDQMFNVEDLPLQEVEYISNGPQTPTVAGDDQTGALIGSESTFFNPNTGQNERVFELNLPQGSGYPYIPAPMLQASVGVIKNTDVTVRYLPQVPLPNDLEVKMFGLGLKHEINQWLPGGNLLPVDLSVQGGFTNLDATLPFEVTPNADQDTENPFPASTWEGQEANFSANAFTINALVGKTLPIISVFGGVGYQTSSVDIGVDGSYPVEAPNDQYNPTDPDSKPKTIEKIDDPVSLSYDENSSLHALIGARLKLLIFNISASYTLSEYPIAQVGVGIGIR